MGKITRVEEKMQEIADDCWSKEELRELAGFLEDMADAIESDEKS